MAVRLTNPDILVDRLMSVYLTLLLEKGRDVVRAHVRWTPELDGRLRGFRGSGMTWDSIAGAMGLGRNTVLERGRKIGARRALPALPSAPEEARDRAPRQAGHPTTWAMITAGTLLEGEPYPYPVFL